MSIKDHLRPLRSLLKEIGSLAEEASLTGSFRGGEAPTARKYNHCLAQLSAEGLVPQGLFSPISEQDCHFGAIGVEAKLLSGYLKGLEDKEHPEPSSAADPGILTRLAPFLEEEDFNDLVRSQIEAGAHIDMEMITHIAPFLESRVLADLMRSQMNRDKPKPPAPPSPPTPPSPHHSESGLAPIEPFTLNRPDHQGHY